MSYRDYALKWRVVFWVLVAGIIIGGCSEEVTREETRILVFSKTEGFRHASIEQGIEALQLMGKKHGFAVDTTENAAMFTEENLARYSAVVFLNTTGDVLDHFQQAFFERYIQAGGGFVGVHAASDTEYHWPWFGKLVGAYFSNHPEVQEASLRVVKHDHPSTDSLPDLWKRTDEWYNFYNLNEQMTPLIMLDENSYEGGKNGENHPIAWYHDFDGGRSFYTGLGHTPESYREEGFLFHLLGGIRYAIGDNNVLDYSAVKREPVPEESRFTKVIIEEKLDEPTELAVFSDDRLLYVQRKGEVKLYDPKTGIVKEITRLEVYHKNEDGLMGVAIDPAYDTNHWIYLYYSKIGDKPVNVLSRFEFRDDQLIMESEKVLLEVVVQREECCHTGGSITFDKHGNLYLSTGDNTNPFKSQGFAPIDERTGRSPFDAQGSSANTNDLRGKILRITPQDDGTYTIPKGNLFAEQDTLARPEIYVMGNRNPYRISVDKKTGYLYWGEVGPDAGNDSPLKGPRGHDEINQARRAGFFGWPYFVGDNKPYQRMNFEDDTPLGFFDAAAPENHSPNNTGMTKLPPAQKAFIWYPYAESPEFPLVKQGGRNAMAGEVFYKDDFTQSEASFPGYYDGKLFIYDWIRGWIMTVTMDEDSNFEYMEPFMASTKFSHPMDMQFASDGSLYLLEYGNKWFAQNDDAVLSRITFNAGNRMPVAIAKADQVAGKAPLTVQFSADGSFDDDKDKLRYTWTFSSNEKVRSNEKNPSFVFANPGIYYPKLTVTDGNGGTSTTQMEIKVGNAIPEVSLALAGNTSFYWDDTALSYAVKVSDQEDGNLSSGIKDQDVAFSIDYLAQGYDITQVAQGHQTSSGLKNMLGKRLIEKSDCKSCHTLDMKSIGPAYTAVAEKYKDDKNAVAYLSGKIIQGGGGVWGEQAMSAHPQLTREDVAEMVKYILSLADDKDKTPQLPLSGTFVANQHQEAKEKGIYILRAAYTDKGSEKVGPLAAEDVVILRNALVPVATADKIHKAKSTISDGKTIVSIRSNGYFVFKGIDLQGIKQLVFNGKVNAPGGKISVRVGTPDGKEIANGNLMPGADITKIDMSARADHERQDIYFVITHATNQNNPLIDAESVHFLKDNGQALAEK